MKRKISQLILIFIVVLYSVNSINAQVFTGFSAFKELIEYEGQRYLMESIYQIKSEDYDKLKIDKTIKEVDSDEGFMFVLTSYTFNGESGVVITSFNSTNFANTKHQFVNVHLTNDQYQDLYNTFHELANKKPKPYEHILRKYNDRLIVDVNRGADYSFFTLWVDYHSRHTFTTTKWDRAYKRHNKFLE
jgi:hypothetical protein